MKSLDITIVASVFYPRISPRALRITELAKELSKLGHQVTVYAKLGSFDYTDFEKEYGLTIKSLKSSSFDYINSDGNISLPLWKKGLIYLLKRWLEFPDILLMHSVYKVLKKEQKIDVLITVALPYPIHWGTAHAKKHLKHLKQATWISDCGDPYMGNPLSNHPFYFKYIEKYWCRQTDYVTVPIEQAKDGYYKEFQDKIRVIPQGFNFENVELSTYEKNVIPTFAYSGTVYPKSRDPRQFLDYLCSLKKPFKFVVYTNKRDLFIPYLEKLAEKIEIRNYVPHDELLKELSKMDFLINIKNESSVQQPSKLIDYYLACRPILEISSSFKEQNVFEEFIAGNYANQLKCGNIEEFDIKNIAIKFLQLYRQR